MLLGAYKFYVFLVNWYCIIRKQPGNSLMVLWLGLSFSLPGPVSIPGWGANILYALWYGQKRKKKEDAIIFILVNFYFGKVYMKINKQELKWFFYGDPLFVANLLAAVLNLIEGFPGGLCASSAGGKGSIPGPPGWGSSLYPEVLPWWLSSKESACQCEPNEEMWVLSLVREDPLEKEMATHSSILVWKIPWTGKPGRLQSMGLQRFGHDWATKQQGL